MRIQHHTYYCSTHSTWVVSLRRHGVHLKVQSSRAIAPNQLEVMLDLLITRSISRTLIRLIEVGVEI